MTRLHILADDSMLGREARARVDHLPLLAGIFALGDDFSPYAAAWRPARPPS